MEPFAYQASKLFFTNITLAQVFNTRVSGARHPFLIASMRDRDPFECISKRNISQAILSSFSLLYASTEILRVKSSV